MSYHFGASDILAALGLTADLTVQESAENKTTQNAVIVDKNGNSLTCSNEAFDVKYEKTITFKASCTVNTLGFVIGGQGTDGVVLTNVTISRVNNDYPTVTATAHKHNGLAADHMATSANVNAWTVAAESLDFGIGSELLFTAVGELQSQTVSWTVQHVDRLNNDGDHLIGNSHGLRKDVTETIVYNDIAPDFGPGYIEDSINTRTVNVNFYECTATAHKFDV